jgi:deoxyribonuclease II
MVSAVNETGKAVDWAFWYKVPKLSGGTNNDSATGFEYAYCDSDNPTPSKSPHTLDSGSGVLAETLAQLERDGVGYILYNDERPDGKPDNGELGHTKGVLAWDTAAGVGFWLIDSWPLFPVLGAKEPPTPIYGQTFLCLSLSLEMLGYVAKSLYAVHQAQVYEAKVGASDPQAFHILAGEPHKNTGKITLTLDMTTVGGMPFKLIGKNRQWSDDFWNDLVGPTLGVDLHVETWIRGPIAPVADSDGIHKSFDVKYINLGPAGIHYAWPETSDHAKWAISADPSQPWVCVGDINRMLSQRKRGGGCVAFQNLALWSALSKTDLIIAPPGMTKAQAHAHVKTTHAPSKR